MIISGLPTRLEGGSCFAEGRVEVQHEGSWGTLCDDEFDMKDANVVCKSLGYGSAISATKQPYFGQGVDLGIVLDDMRCTGIENNLGYCAHNDFNDHNCDHSEDAGVICEPGILK